MAQSEGKQCPQFYMIRYCNTSRVTSSNNKKTPGRVVFTERYRLFSLLLRLFQLPQPRQGLDCGGQFDGCDVRVDLHGELDVGVPCQQLGCLRSDAGPTEVRNERVPHISEEEQVEAINSLPGLKVKKVDDQTGGNDNC